MKLPLYLYSMHHVCPKSVTCCELSECFPSTPRCEWRMPLRLCSHNEQEKPNKEYFRQSLVCIAKSHHNQQLHEEPVAISTFSALLTLQMSELYNAVSGQSCWLRNSTWDKGHLWEISRGKGISSTISQEMCSRPSLTLTPRWRDTGGKVLEVVRPLMMQRPNHHS